MNTIEPPLHIVLVQPLIPPNTGNVARLCAATGCTLHLVEPLGFSLDDRQLKRAGLDYWEHVSVSVWPDFLHLQHAMGPRPFHLFSSRVKRTYTQAPYRSGDMLVFGNEENGLPDNLLLAHADCTYTIPMWGAVRSLNLSISVGIVTYDALRVIHGF